MEEKTNQITVGDVLSIDHGDGCKTLFLISGEVPQCCWNHAEIYQENIVNAQILSGGCPHYSLPTPYRSGHHNVAHLALNAIKNAEIWL